MNGLVVAESQKSVKDTAESLARLIEANGLRVFARIDHAANAAEIGMALRPTELLIFGHPKGGTPLMQDQQSAGLDLPFKALVWQDESARVWVTYPDPGELVERHGLGPASLPVIATITAGVARLVDAACRS